MTQRSDPTLVRAAARGDAGAWDALVDRYAGLVAAVVRAERVPLADQPDAFQYVFLELYRRLDRLEDTANLGAWLRVVASRHSRRLRDMSARTVTSPTGSELEAVPDEGDTERDLLLAERRHTVLGALEELSPKCRALVERLFFEDPPRPYDEVAAELGLAVGSIGLTRRRCLERLERLLRARGLP